MQNTIIYPGTFDPITNGHVDIINKALKIFPKVIVGVAVNEAKKPYFLLEDRVRFIENSFNNNPNVKVLGFSGLLVDFVKSQNSRIILRGLRAVSDFEYEFQLAGIIRKLSPDIETIFLTPSEDSMFISSTLVRELVSLKADISKFVPESVVEFISRD
jgi:pantetheine-phosphate adenylyltransferase